MKSFSGLAALLFVLSTAGAALSQRSQDQGDWPCRQVKVPNLSAASVWTGPSIDEAVKKWRDDTVVSDLVSRISVRKTPIETAESLVREFAKASGDRRAERLTLLFAGVYDRLETERREVLAGLDRYGRMQKEFAEKLRTETQEMRAEQDKPSPDPQKLKQLSEALQWDMRIFDERRQAVGYVCETPALIEQRLGALARAIQAAL